MSEQYNKIHLGSAKCNLDLGDGSERAEYVNQDYILQQLGRPHRNVNIMYTLYPKDSQWPARISVACKDMDIKFQWDYPYDDYFPFDAEGEPFAQMRDIRKHGQDVLLTLTVDCSLEDEYLRKVARQLRPFGRMKIRINHECDGTWFTHNKRFTYEEVGKFFVRFHNIIKEEAPNVSTIFCAGMLNAEGTAVGHEAEFLEAYKVADYWSADAYLALHYGWPYNVAEVGGEGHVSYTVDARYDAFKNTTKYLWEKIGKKTPFLSAEFNADGDVTGAVLQGEPIKRFAEKLKADDELWFNGFSMYQFRDRGRLGLEQEDPNNKANGIVQPLLADYKTLLDDPYFRPEILTMEETQFPATLRWGGAEDAEGIETKIVLEKMPVFFEATLEKDLALMMEVNGRWFYKAPGVDFVDFMPAFWGKEVKENTEVCVRIFATPATGENEKTAAADWDVNYYAKMTQAPAFRIRYEAPGVVG